MNTCLQCKKEYEFYGQKRPICRSCKQSYDREYHRCRSEQKKKDKVRKQRNRIKDLLRWVGEIKKKAGCTDCGITDYRVLDFDHLPEYFKNANVSDLARQGRSKDVIQKEINKCEVVCANCHRIRTYMRRD